MFSSSGLSLAVDNCPERMHAVDAEAPRPPRVEFWSGLGVETEVEEAAVLTMRRFFWCTMKKTLCLLFFLPESCRIN